MRNIGSNPLRVGRRIAFAASMLAALGASSTAYAQLRPGGKPVLRTPGTVRLPVQATAGGAGAPGGAGATGAPATGGPATGAPSGAQGSGAQGSGAQGAQGSGAQGSGANGGKPVKDPNDPLSSVAQGSKEIDFKPKAGNFLVSFNLDDADLPELVKAISNVTGKRFIYGSKLKSIKATVYSPEKVTAAEAYAAFLSILDANGLTVIPQGQFLKIVESQGAVSQTTPVYGTATPVPAEDRYVTRLYRLSNVDATEVGKALEKFKSKDGDISIYAPGNLLIITETGTNIRRMLRIVEEIDVGSAGDQIWVQPVVNGSAKDLAQKLNDILGLKKGGAPGSPGGGPGGANIVPDERTNSLVITSTKGDYDRILELFKRIDVPMSGEGQLHVVPLQHAQCVELSATLNAILGIGVRGGTTGARPGTPGSPTTTPTTTPTTGTPTAGGGGTGAADDIFEGKVKVTCDEATNSLVTTSSLRDYAQLREVVDKLDKPRRQVFIEAVIMDLDVEHSTDLGLSYHGGAPFTIDGKQSFFYGGNNVKESVIGVPSSIEALALGVRGPDIQGSQNLFGPGISIPALGVVMHALGKDSDSNVLATPHVLATDNIEATISIGQTIPLQTNLGLGLGSLASSAGGASAAGLGALLGGGLGGLTGQNNYKDVGTKIVVKPHVNDSDQVRLDIDEEISDLGARDGALGAASINKRTAKTTLIVRDQQTVVIGGLMRDQYTVGETKIPILGDIPVLGFFFRQQQKQKHKTNLLLILTPYVVRDQDDLRAIFERKMQERQEFLDRYFVFNENAAWQPPLDFSRKNGLVEAIRQAMLDTDERTKIAEDAKRRTKKTHDPVEPVPVPSISGSSKSGTSSAPESGGAVPPQQPKVLPQGTKLRTGSGMSPPRQRVE